MAKVLLFDLDGTLIDSATGVFASFRQALAAFPDIHIPERDLYRFLGTAIRELLPMDYGCTMETTLALEARFMEHYRAVGQFQTTVIQPMHAFVRRLKAQGVSMAVASCKPWEFCCSTLALCGYDGCFSAVVGSYHNGVPEIKSAVIREALRQLGATPADAVMIGDRAADVLGAAELGIPCIGVDFCGYAAEHELQDAGAIAIVSSATELESFLNTHLWIE